MNVNDGGLMIDNLQLYENDNRQQPTNDGGSRLMVFNHGK